MTPAADVVGPSGPALRRRVQDSLARSKSYRALPPAERRELAENMERTLAFLQEAGVPEGAMPLAAAQGAAGEGTRVMSRLVREVDFPAFVSGLIHGVFRSIVDSSVQQMQEYAKFLESVVKSVNQFADEEVSEDESRSYLTDRFPQALARSPADQGSRLALKPELDEKDLPDFQSLFGLSDELDLSDEEGEKKLVEAGRLAVARQRQQLLATMVLLGINRIIVTDGEIKAAVVFDVSARETARGSSESASDATASDTASDTSAGHREGADQDSYQSTGRSADSVAKYAFDAQRSRVQTRVSTQHSQQRSSNDQSLDVAAKLTGSVTVKFRSETFPLERMASPMELASLNQKAQR